MRHCLLSLIIFVTLWFNNVILKALKNYPILVSNDQTKFACPEMVFKELGYSCEFYTPEYRMVSSWQIQNLNQNTIKLLAFPTFILPSDSKANIEIEVSMISTGYNHTVKDVLKRKEKKNMTLIPSAANDNHIVVADIRNARNFDNLMLIIKLLNPYKLSEQNLTNFKISFRISSDSMIIYLLKWILTGFCIFGMLLLVVVFREDKEVFIVKVMACWTIVFNITSIYSEFGIKPFTNTCQTTLIIVFWIILNLRIAKINRNSSTSSTSAYVYSIATGVYFLSSFNSQYYLGPFQTGLSYLTYRYIAFGALVMIVLIPLKTTLCKIKELTYREEVSFLATLSYFILYGIFLVDSNNHFVAIDIYEEEAFNASTTFYSLTVQAVYLISGNISKDEKVVDRVELASFEEEYNDNTDPS